MPIPSGHQHAHHQTLSHVDQPREQTTLVEVPVPRHPGPRTMAHAIYGGGGHAQDVLGFNGQSQLLPDDIRPRPPYQTNITPSTPTPSANPFGLMLPPQHPQHFQQQTQQFQQQPQLFQPPNITPNQTSFQLPPTTPNPTPIAKMLTRSSKKGSKKTVIFDTLTDEEDDEFADLDLDSDSEDSYIPRQKPTSSKSSTVMEPSAASSSSLGLLNALNPSGGSSTPIPSAQTIQTLFALPDSIVALHPAYQRLQNTCNTLMTTLTGMNSQLTVPQVKDEPQKKHHNYTDEQKKAMYYDIKDACAAWPTRKLIKTANGKEYKMSPCSPQDIPLGRVMYESPGVLMSDARFGSMQKDILFKVQKTVLKWPIPPGAEKNRKNIRQANREKYEDFLESLCLTWSTLDKCENRWKADLMVGRQIKYANRQISVKIEEVKAVSTAKGKMKETARSDSEDDSTEEGSGSFQPPTKPPNRPQPTQRMTKTLPQIMIPPASKTYKGTGPGHNPTVAATTTVATSTNQPKPNQQPVATSQVPPQTAQPSSVHQTVHTQATSNNTATNPTSNPVPAVRVATVSNDPNPTTNPPATTNHPVPAESVNTVSNNPKPATSPTATTVKSADTTTTSAILRDNANIINPMPLTGTLQLSDGSAESTPVPETPTTKVPPNTSMSEGNSNTTPAQLTSEMTLKTLDKKTLLDIVAKRDLAHSTSSRPPTLAKLLVKSLSSHPLTAEETTIINTALNNRKLPAPKASSSKRTLDPDTSTTDRSTGQAAKRVRTDRSVDGN